MPLPGSRFTSPLSGWEKTLSLCLEQPAGSLGFGGPVSPTTLNGAESQGRGGHQVWVMRQPGEGQRTSGEQGADLSDRKEGSEEVSVCGAKATRRSWAQSPQILSPAGDAMALGTDRSSRGPQALLCQG